MTLLHYLALQPVEDEDGSELDQFVHDEEITLEERPDQGELNEFWQHVSDDIHADPEWFQFADE